MDTRRKRDVMKKDNSELTVTEAALLCGVTRRSIQKWILSGDLKAKKVNALNYKKFKFLIPRAEIARKILERE